MTTAKKTAFLFPGQGSQYVGMGKSLAANNVAAAKVFAIADEILGFSLSELCWHGPEDELNDTYNAQPALFVTSIATLRALQDRDYSVSPAFVAGHSLGEYTAYVAAEALTFEDGLKLVRTRGRLMRQAGQEQPGKMAAILKLDEASLSEICTRLSEEGHVVQIANYNAPGQIVISGSVAGVEAAMAQAEEAGARRVVPLNVSIAAHSKLMDGVRQDFIEAIHQSTLNPPKIPIIANLSASPITEVEAIRHEMIHQLTDSVQWSQGIKAMITAGVTTFLEIGPKNVLSGLTKRIDRSVTARSIETVADIDSLLEEKND